MTERQYVLPRWCAPAARVAACAYGAAINMRNARFDQGVGVRRVARPVISVGNIVAGGTGKSPMVRWIAQWALDHGMKPLIALRGYRSKDGRSDEALEHQSLVPGAHLAVGANRFKTIEAALARNPSIDVVILDDGFQHRALARDLDLVLVHGSHPHLDGALLPLGWLREPPASLARAHGVIVTHCDGMNDRLSSQIEAVHQRGVLAWCAHSWDGVDVYHSGGQSRCVHEGLDWLRGRRLAVWAGIAKPTAVVEKIRACGGDVVSMPHLRDHATYGCGLVSRLTALAHEANANAIVLTHKDWVKVRADSRAVDLPIVVPRLRLQFAHGESALRALLENFHSTR